MKRLAIIDDGLCKPKKCGKQCKKFCPIVCSGKKVIDIENIAIIHESLCTGCNICTKKCPFKAIKIINLPTELSTELIHRYGTNGFCLYKLPKLRTNHILGLIGQNGIGKSTLISIMSGLQLPSITTDGTDKWYNRFKGTEMQNYFEKLYTKKHTSKIKHQFVNSLVSHFKRKKQNPSVSDFLYKSSEDVKRIDTIIHMLRLTKILDRKIITLSGGELQRVYCAHIMSCDANVYFFDEPSTFLDVKQRLNLGYCLRWFHDKENTGFEKHTIIIDHDLLFIDYVTDQTSILYGSPGGFGVTSFPSTTNRAINNFFEGYLPQENVRFRSTPFSMKKSLEMTDEVALNFDIPKGEMTKGTFNLKIIGGLTNQITVILGENGTGKTTFFDFLLSKLDIVASHKPQELDIDKYKSSKIYPTVSQFMEMQIGSKYYDVDFQSEIVKPLDINRLLDHQLNALSGGELQRVFIVSTLGKSADIYLLDEPSAYLDIEQRAKLTLILRRFFANHKCIGFVIEHDLMMAISIAMGGNLVICNTVTDTHEKKTSVCSKPQNCSDGFNDYLKSLNITIRRDPIHKRPRINRIGSTKDKDQKTKNIYFAE
jgi:ATP-binding cassette, sub-family E, member 1